VTRHRRPGSPNFPLVSKASVAVSTATLVGTILLGPSHIVPQGNLRATYTDLNGEIAHHRTLMSVLVCITPPIQANTLTLHWFVLGLYSPYVSCVYSISEFCIFLVLKTSIQTNTYINRTKCRPIQTNTDQYTPIQRECIDYKLYVLVCIEDSIQTNTTILKCNTNQYLLLIEYNTDKYRPVLTNTYQFSVNALNTNFTYWYVLTIQYRQIQTVRAGVASALPAAAGPQPAGPPPSPLSSPNIAGFRGGGERREGGREHLGNVRVAVVAFVGEQRKRGRGEGEGGKKGGREGVVL
jgi:hypothetical protein